MTSGYLKANSVMYENFVGDGQSIDHFCATNVEPMDKLTDHLCISAIVNALGQSRCTKFC